MAVIGNNILENTVILSIGLLQATVTHKHIFSIRSMLFSSACGQLSHFMATFNSFEL